MNDSILLLLYFFGLIIKFHVVHTQVHLNARIGYGPKMIIRFGFFLSKPGVSTYN